MTMIHDTLGTRAPDHDSHPTHSHPAHSLPNAFWATALDGVPEASLSLDRCIDWLLDLHQATEHPQLRRLITEVLDDLRRVGSGPLGFAELELDDLVLGALASVEAAFDVIHRSV